MDKHAENKFSDDPGNDIKVYLDTIRKQTHNHSFLQIADWIRNTNKLITEKKARRRKRLRKLSWFAISFLSICFIVSCTYRVERVETSGSLVNFVIDKHEKQSFERLFSLQKVFTFTSFEFLQPGDPGIASFILFIPDNEQNRVIPFVQELKLLSGLRKLDVSPVTYNIKESLFSTFLHKSLKVGKRKLKSDEIISHIHSALEKKGLGFLSVKVLSTKSEKVSFTRADQYLSIRDTLTSRNTPPGKSTNIQTNTERAAHANREKLQLFNWLLGTWSVKYVPRPTFHYWMRMNDTLLMCFIIKYEDDEPDVSIGFSINYSAADSAILSLRGIEWEFLSANNKEINFKNNVTPKSANVKWSFNDEKKTWQSVISGERNLEIVNLVRNEDANFEDIVKGFITKNPGKIKL
jgi:hypothetical protein